MSDILKIIASNIKQYREMKDITQQELSILCGLHRNYIGSIENENRNISIVALEKIANGLNVPIERLIK